MESVPKSFRSMVVRKFSVPEEVKPFRPAKPVWARTGEKRVRVTSKRPQKGTS